MELINGEKEIINTSQSIYDSFNDFIFSEDKKVLSKLIARTILYDKVKDIPGDIVECGVFKGSGILSWLKLKHILSYNSFKKVIGFDFFDSKELINSLSGKDKETMEALFKSRKFDMNSSYVEYLSNTIIKAGFNVSDFELIEGDVSATTKDFCSKRPGFKISLLYLDMDLEKPTYDTLNNFWNRVSKGGIVVLDEYGYHQWSESLGVDRFLEENNLEIKLLNFQAPTAYIQK